MIRLAIIISLAIFFIMTVVIVNYSFDTCDYVMSDQEVVLVNCVDH